MRLIHLSLAAIPLAWLLPNHYSPWPSAWQDGFALALLTAAVFTLPRQCRLPTAWLFTSGLAAASVLVQWAMGRLHFGGDALMVVGYLAAFVLSIAVGDALQRAGGPLKEDGLLALLTAIVAAAIVSVGIAALQWTDAIRLGIYVAELPPGSRPFGNVAQPNHLCTIAFMGLCCVFYLHQVGQVHFPALLGALYALAVLGWPRLNDALLLSGGRSIAEQMQGGTRWLHWAALADAIGREPWLGYGWQQVSRAQQVVSLDHPLSGEHIEHSHNIVLDLLVWAGIPVGLLLVGLIVRWFVVNIRACRDAGACWLLAAVGGVLVHGMLEYPLEYAYFLIPVGIMVGYVSSRLNVDRSVALPWLPMRVFSVAFVGMFCWVGMEYLTAEENHRTLRLESARIGVPGIRTPAPDLTLLTQLEAFLEFARTEARVGMRPLELDAMRRVSQRFAYPPVMFRYALAAGLNGRPDVAQDSLGRLCRSYPLQRCEEAIVAWRQAQGKFPVLARIAPPRLPLPRVRVLASTEN